MGWNAGYEIMEATVVGAYKLGVLDKKLLKVLMEPYRNSDIDAGGSNDLKANDGKGVEQIVCSILGIRYPVRPKLPRNEDKWTDEQHNTSEDYYDACYKAFNKATKRYGW